MDMRYLKTYRSALTGVLLVLLTSFGINLHAQNEPIGFRLSGASVTEKDTFQVAIHADSLLTGREVYSYRFYMTYSPSYFEFLDVQGTGSMLNSWGLPVVNGSNAATLVLAGAGRGPRSGSGEMIYLRFLSLRSGNAWISFDAGEIYLHQGNPASQYVNGYISSAAISYPNIYPDQASLYIGDEVKMTVSGGEGPYTYSVSDDQVASITGGDTVRAIGPGKTRVSVTDANGEVSTTTGVFDIRAIRMDLQEVAVWPADTFFVPVRLEIAPGTSVYSGRFELAHSGYLTGLTGDIIPGDYPQAIIENNAKSGRMNVSFASTTGITGNGLLCYLAFRANNSGNQYIRFENMRFNETLLAWATKSNYYINVRSLPTLYMSPSSGTLMWGELVKLNVTNGTAPYSYSVSDPEVATVDIQGNLTAITGGQVRVTATDVNGASVTSGTFTVADHEVRIFPSEGVLDTETRVPIVTSSLPSGKAVFGFRAGVTFDENFLEFAGAEAAGGNGLVTASQSGSNVNVAGALSQGVSSGVLGYLLFNVKNSLPLGNSTTISLNAFSANENSLVSTRQNGTLTRVEQTSYRPVAIAGLDFSLQEGTQGQLDGTASFDLDNDPLTYSWSAPEGFLLSDPTSATPEFIAPYVEEDTEYTLTLVVNDGTNDSDEDQVKVTVLQVNFPPEANAGPDKNYVEGSSVSLDGSQSFDPDGDALSFTWKALDNIILFDANSVSPSFILPQVTENTTYRFSLVVNDGVVNSAGDTVVITSINVNKKPVAFAGGDFSLDENSVGALDGSLSFDADNDPLTYHWTAPNEVILSSATVAEPTFTAPAVIRDSVLLFTLVVNDGVRDSDPDMVRVTVVNLDILNTETYIEAVTLPGLDSATIDTSAATVMLHLPYGTDIRSIAPQFTLSEGAFMSPANGSVQDFSTPVYYRVTAEDGFTGRNWKVEVYQPGLTMERILDPGWNWLSLNLQPADRSIVTLFGDLTFEPLDYLKSNEYSAVYYPATGWFGNLSTFPRNKILRMKKGSGESLIVQGPVINPVVTPVPMLEGWNDLPFLLRENAALDEAFEASTLPGGDLVIKGSTGSAIYYEASGWEGELDSLRVLHGYRMHAMNSGNVYYNPAITARKSGGTEHLGHMELLREAGLDPAKYEYSATLIADAVSGDGNYAAGEGDRLIAYNGEEIRGIAQATYVPALDRHLFIMTCYSNELTEEVRLVMLDRFTDDNDRTGQLEVAGEYQALKGISFGPDEIIGLPYMPLQLLFPEMMVGIRHEVTTRIDIYPNPSVDRLQVSSIVSLETVRIFDLSGKKLIELEPGARTINLSIQHLAPGVYTLEAETTGYVHVIKFVKTSR